MPENSGRLPEQARKAIRELSPFQTGQLVGYITHGGTYIVASTPLANDDDRYHDLVAMLPFVPGHVLAEGPDGEPTAALVQLRVTAMFDGIVDALGTTD